MLEYAKKIKHMHEYEIYVQYAEPNMHKYKKYE